jgi:hypothetical protein
MALTPEELARREELAKQLNQVGYAKFDPNLKAEYEALNKKAEGPSVGERLSKGWEDLKTTQKSMHGDFSNQRAQAYLSGGKPSTLSGIQSDAKGQPLSPIGPTAKAELEQNAPPAAPAPLSAEAQAAADKVKKDEEDKLKKSKEFNPNSIVTAMNSLADKMKDVPEEMKAELQKPGGPMDLINKSLEQFNRDYQADQQSAKDKTEKAKNRAEWASIASMLAKNVVGYAAALNGVDPNAMAYQTTDWEKHIQGLNAELDMNLGHIRENMKMKVEGKLGEKKDLQGQMDDTFKARMESLRSKMEGKKAEFQAGLQMSEAEKDRNAKEQLAQTKAEGSTTTKTEDVAPKVQQALGKAAEKKTMKAGLAELKGIAVQLGKDPNQIDALVKKYQGNLDWGEPNEVAPEAQSKIAQYLSGVLTKTTVIGKSGAGQPAAPVVQSPIPASTLKTIVEGTKGTAKDGTPVVFKNGSWVSQ